MELVETRKVAFSYVDLKRKKGTKTVLNSVRMTFEQEDGGTDLYFKKADNGFTFSKEPDKNAVMREVKYQKSPSGKKTQKYINMMGIVDQEGIYDIYKVADNCYQAYLNTEKQKQVERNHRGDSARISRNNELYVPKKIIGS